MRFLFWQVDKISVICQMIYAYLQCKQLKDELFCPVKSLLTAYFLIPTIRQVLCVQEYYLVVSSLRLS